MLTTTLQALGPASLRPCPCTHTLCLPTSRPFRMPAPLPDGISFQELHTMMHKMIHQVSFPSQVLRKRSLPWARGSYPNLNFILVFVPMSFVPCRTGSCRRAGARAMGLCLQCQHRADLWRGHGLNDRLHEQMKWQSGLCGNVSGRGLGAISK